VERSTFRTAVFERDNGACVVCGQPAQDAHHILERRLWNDGGYHLDNGASLCGPHHLDAESTIISVEDLRLKCGITRKVIPEHMYDDEVYDKWGNCVLPNGQRTKGELFNDESVQKVLAPVLHLFTDRVKYPRTYHLPFSRNITDDDRVISDLNIFCGKQVVITEKMDGENTTMYRDAIHARSIDSGAHPSRTWVKQFWAQIKHDIPPGWRICGENVYAKHSIYYEDLKSYFYGFSIWDSNNLCLDWHDTLVWFQLFGIEPVPTLYLGLYDQQVLDDLTNRDWKTSEGYVVRLDSVFSYRNFRDSVAKYVREKHVQTVKHWMHGQPVIPNKLL